MHEPPEGYGHEPYPGQPQGQGGYPPPHQGQGGYPPQQPPYPGPGQPPYPGPGAPSPYGGQPPPAGDPWGRQGMGGGFGPPGPPGPGGWGPPPGPPRKNSGPIVGVAIVAVLVLLGGGGAIIWALSSGTKKPAPVAVSTAPTAEPSDTIAAPPPSDSGPPFPSSAPTSDPALTAQAGDCVKNTGTEKSPHLETSTCHSGAYKVLRRFYATSNYDKCKSVPGYTAAYRRRNTSYSVLSFVLCLKKL